MNTGEEVVTVSAMEIAAETLYPETVNTPLGVLPPVSPPPGVNSTRSLSNQLANQAEQFEPVATAYNANAAAQNRTGQTGEKVLTIDDAGAFQEVTDGTVNQVLTTNGSGVVSFSSQLVQLASLSARVTTFYLNNYYYGNSSYGWNYPIWSGITFNNTQGNPYARQIADDYAHCGILVTHDMSSVQVTGTIRNDSSSDNLGVILIKASRPNGSASNMVGTEVGSTTVTVGTQDRHYNFTFTGTSVDRGELLFLGINRTAGSQTTRYVNFTATIVGNKA